MSKLDMDTTPPRRQFKDEIEKLYGDDEFTMQQAKDALASAGLPKSKWSAIYQHVLMKHCGTGTRGVFSFANAFSKNTEKTVTTKKKILEKDMAVVNEKETAEYWDKKAEVAKSKYSQKAIISKPKVVQSNTISLVPIKDPQYVAWGHFRDIKTIISRKIFYPIFVTGLSGNGKTSMIHEVCAKLKRDLIRVNITVETDEDDLLGGFRLVDGETVWQDGPIINAMRRGSVALIDEIDLASHKIMCLQPVLEGKPIYLKKINEVVYPEPGFNVVATANTKGKGSDDGRFIGTNILNEAFLDRFSATFYQEYPSQSHEQKILNKQFEKYEVEAGDFVEKLVKWADVIRKSFKEGAVDEIITTRRLIDISKSFFIFNDKMKAVTMCLERFDDETRESFCDLYTKIDAGVSLEEEVEVEVDDTENAKPVDNKDDVPF